MPSPRWPNLDLMFDETNKSIDLQIETGRALDTKANFVLTSATVLIASTVLSQQTFVNSSLSDIILPLILIMGFIYVILIISAYQAYQVQGYRTSFNPPYVVARYLEESDTERVKATLLSGMVEFYKSNSSLLKKKAQRTNFALLCLAIEVSLFVAVFVLRNIILTTK